MVQGIFMHHEGSHDWYHIDRVRNLALLLSEKEGGDRFIVEMASLLHDLDDRKLTAAIPAGTSARSWLDSLPLARDTAGIILQVIAEVSYRGAGVPTPCSSPESMIVQDADRLDALGAIGIARAFAYGGSKNRPLHIPDNKPVLHTGEEDYSLHSGTSVNHFHEKLLLLKDRLNTETARKLANGRHRFMEEFLYRFNNEWNIEKSETD